MKTLEEYPLLVKEWHPTKNGNLTPNKVTHGSHKKVWWKCSVSDDHEWETTISARTAIGRGHCPFCSGRKVSKTNSLKTCFPKTAKEWHPTKNGNLTPDKITKGSHKKVWWKCIVADDHEWETSVKSRSQLIGARGCPFCSKSGKASSTNNLALNNPEIAKQWHPTKNGDLTPKQVRSNSTKKVWWLCVEGHEYLHSVNQRTSRTIKCPICSGYRIEQGNSLADKFPDIAAEWDFEKNGDITPDKISARNNKKYWYKCKLNHSYNSRTADRTTGGGCPKCTKQSSQPELRIYSELKYLFPDTLNKHKVKNVELDIFIPSLKLAVEYDGSYWHKKSEKRDIRKNHFCQRNGMKLIRVRQSPLPKILDTDIIFSARNFNKLEMNILIKAIFYKLLTVELIDGRIKKYLDSKNFKNDKFFETFKTYFPLPRPSESFAANYPKLAKSWDYKKNYPLTPECFTSGSNRKVYWNCRKGHSYLQTIHDRRNAVTCPVCYKTRGTGKSYTNKDKRQLRLI